MAWQQAALIGGSAALQAYGQASANKKNLQIAREQMAFQERMASTAHQRQVADMKKAGLNPMLSAMGGSGAASPQGASAQMQNVAQGASSTALQYKALKKDLTLADQKIALDKAAEKSALESAKVNQASAAKIHKENKILDRELEVMKHEAEWRNEKAKQDKKFYKYEKMMNLVGSGVSGLIGGAATGLVGGSLKGIAQGKKALKKSKKMRKGTKPKNDYYKVHKNTGEILP